jgi:hypothetical protein
MSIVPDGYWNTKYGKQTKIIIIVGVIFASSIIGFSFYYEMKHDPYFGLKLFCSFCVLFILSCILLWLYLRDLYYKREEEYLKHRQQQMEDKIQSELQRIRTSGEDS